jgi:hypothetical protein
MFSIHLSAPHISFKPHINTESAAAIHGISTGRPSPTITPGSGGFPAPRRERSSDIRGRKPHLSQRASTASIGKHASGLPQGYRKLTLPDGGIGYVAQGASHPDRPRSILTYDPATHSMKQTAKLAIPDGRGRWKLVHGLRGGMDRKHQASSSKGGPSAPKKAKMDESELHTASQQVDTLKTRVEKLKRNIGTKEQQLRQSQSVLQYNQNIRVSVSADRSRIFNLAQQRFPGGLVENSGEPSEHVYRRLAPLERSEFNALRSQYAVKLRSFVENDRVILSHTTRVQNFQTEIGGLKNQLSDAEANLKSAQARYDKLAS